MLHLSLPALLCHGWQDWQYAGMQDGGDAFQGASAAAVLEAIALVLALTFPDTAAVPDFRAPTRPPLGGSG